jgi:TetR/AcrR family transcriptional repressor of nem operon
MARPSTARERLTDAAMELIWEHSYGATSVDDICARADVRKGSFYHFFKSKSELAATALEEDWRKNQSALDAAFSPTVPPLERFRRSLEFGYEKLAAQKQRCGAVLGCPLYALGSEVCTLDAALRDKIQEIIGRKFRYYESAIRDAHAQGLIHAPDARAKAEALFAFVQGVLIQARIQNDLEVLRRAYPALLDLLGSKAPEPATNA